MKNGKSNFGFLYRYIKYGKFSSISMDHFIKHKPFISEEWVPLPQGGGFNFLTPAYYYTQRYFFFIFCRILALQQIDLWFDGKTEDTYQIIFNFPHRCRKLFFSLVLITVRFSSSISKQEQCLYRKKQILKYPELQYFITKLS